MKLQPLSEFVAAHVKGEWQATNEYYVHPSERMRFKITVEQCVSPSLQDSFIGLWRQDELAEQGISADCQDAIELGEELVKTLHYHLSPHQTQHIVNALQRDLDKWHAERQELFTTNPELIWASPPEPLHISCPD